MTATIKGLVGELPTSNEKLISWISESVELFQPERVVFVDGSQEEADRLAGELVEKGTLIKLNEEKRARTPTWLALTLPTSRVWSPALSSALSLRKMRALPTTGHRRRR